MKAVKFKEQNVTFAENQEEYSPLPAFRDSNGVVVTCWKLSFKERILMLFKGELWHSTMTFNSPLQPLFMSVQKSDVLIYERKGFFQRLVKLIKIWKQRVTHTM